MKEETSTAPCLLMGNGSNEMVIDPHRLTRTPIEDNFRLFH